MNKYKELKKRVKDLETRAQNWGVAFRELRATLRGEDFKPKPFCVINGITVPILRESVFSDVGLGQDIVTYTCSLCGGQIDRIQIGNESVPGGMEFPSDKALRELPDKVFSHLMAGHPDWQEQLARLKKEFLRSKIEHLKTKTCPVLRRDDIAEAEALLSELLDPKEEDSG